MVTIRPIPRALVPADSEAAQAISGPNYDEFQSDREIWELIQRQPQSILRVTMAHCDVTAAPFAGEGSDAALGRAKANLEELAASDRVRTASDLLYVYEIRDGDHAQIGLGGLVPTTDIRTEENPRGVIVRNEGIRPEKAQGRADLIRTTSSLIGAVNNSVNDSSGVFAEALRAVADSRSPSFVASEDRGVEHRVWCLESDAERTPLVEALAREPEAYVADGNHRSAAAGMAGQNHFLAVFFPVEQLGILPYNRLVRTDVVWSDIEEDVEEWFELASAPESPFQPTEPHRIGLYADGEWRELRPRPGSFDPDHAGESIDSDIVQKRLFAPHFGFTNPKDERLQFVGGDRSAAWLASQVDSGEFRYAVTLPAVTIPQFVAVCEQNRFMPPKSTWFDPKIRSGLVIALLD